MPEELPVVSVIVPVRNEQDSISACLDALMGQTYTLNRLEILVVDGSSSDATVEIAQEYCREHPHIRVLHNPKQIASTGLNAGLHEAIGSIILRVDGHCLVEPDYVARCVDRLLHTQAAGVGGPMHAVGLTPVGKAIAIATSCPFGIGDARFHYSNKEEYVDTVYLGAYRRQVFEQFGLFDESLVRNQDDEFNYRLRAAGAKLLLSPAIKSRYFCRTSLRSLFSQYFQYGFWKVRVLQKHPRQMRLRQFAPASFTLAMIVSSALAPFSQSATTVFGLLAALYLTSNLAVSAWLTLTKDRCGIALPAVFPALHFGYGLGFLAGLLRFRDRWRSS